MGDQVGFTPYNKPQASGFSLRVQDQGVELPKRRVVDFQGENVSVSEQSGKIVVAISEGVTVTHGPTLPDVTTRQPNDIHHLEGVGTYIVTGTAAAVVARSDDFNRPNNTGSVGTPSDGNEAWDVRGDEGWITSFFGLLDNRSYKASGVYNGSSKGLALLRLATNWSTDFDMEWTFTRVGSTDLANSGLKALWAADLDYNNAFKIDIIPNAGGAGTHTAVQLYREYGGRFGGQSYLGGYNVTPMVALGDDLVVRILFNRISRAWTLYVNGVQVAAGSDTSGLGAIPAGNNYYGWGPLDANAYHLDNIEGTFGQADTRAWTPTHSSVSAAGVTFTPVGGIAATNVQAAIAELDTEKAASGHSHTAPLAVQDENVAVASGVSILDFQGAGVSAAAGGAGEVVVTIPGGGGGSGGHTIEDAAGTDMTARGKLQFVGATVTDDGANDRTLVTITGGGSAISLDAWKEVGAAGNAAFTSPWQNYGGAYETVAYRRDPFGRIHLKGMAKSGTVGSSIFTLPAGFRPAKGEVFAVTASETDAEIAVYADGTVNVWQGTAAGTWISLSGISFTASDAPTSITGGGGDVGASATRATTQSIPHNAGTKVSFSATAFDTSSFWASGSPTRLTVPVGQAGKYLAIATVDWDNASTSGVRALALQKNGAGKIVEVVDNASSAHMGQQVSQVIDLAAGDYIEAEVYQNSGGSLNLLVSAFLPVLTLVKMGGGSSSTPSFAGCRVYRSAAMNYASGETTLSWDAESYDALGMHDNVTNPTRMTVPTGYSGKWTITAQTSMSDSGGSRRGIWIRKNGVTIAQTLIPTHSSGSVQQVVAPSVPAVAGDYFEVVNYQDSGSTLTTTVGEYGTYAVAKFDGA